MVFARQPLEPPRIRSFANSAGPTPDLVTDIFVIFGRAGGVRRALGAVARVDGVLACCLWWAAAIFERRFVPFF